ncbi:MAG: ABC transporter permease, partial [Verrucomicrobiae bacterium]|nr:ABC transporter permease [Verrucomicrobiae bacterium]
MRTASGGWLGWFCSRLTWRHWRRAPGSSALLAVLVAVGVAVFFAIRLANRAAVASFRNFTEVLASETDALIQARAGFLPEGILGELREALGDAPVRLLPILESTASRPRATGGEPIGSRTTFTLLGVDWIAMQNFVARAEVPPGPDAKAAAPRPEAFDPAAWASFRDPRAVFISAALAREGGLSPGSELPLIVQDRVVPLRVFGVIPEDESRPRAPAHLIVMDLPALQSLTRNPGRLSRIEFLVEEGPQRIERVAHLREVLRSRAPDTAGASRWVVSSPAERRAAAAMMTRAFRLNLTILSLLSLVVGVYLVFQALDGAVIRRRDEIAILRSLGVTAREIRRGWLAEACLLGVLGGLLGLALGWLGAQGAVRLVSRTVNALYHSSSTSAAALDPLEAALALAASVGTCVLAGWLPARAAATTPPAQLLARAQGSREVRRGIWRHPLAAPAWIAAGIVLCVVPPLRLDGGGRFPLAAYVAAMAWVVGAGILGGRLLAVSAARLQFLGRSSLAWRLALSHLR